MARLSFFASSSIWGFQVSLLSRSRPRYLILVDSNIVFWSGRSVIRFVRDFLGGLKTKNSVLATLRERLLAQSHSTSSCNSLLSILPIDSGPLSAKSRLVLSVK